MDSIVATLDRITDRTPEALAGLRLEVRILADAITGLTKAENKKGEDQQFYLSYLAEEVLDRLEELEGLLVGRRP
jgi:hypothetical protein